MTQTATHNKTLVVKVIACEIDMIDRAITECQDESGVCRPWMNARMNELVRIKESFRNCIEYFETQVYNNR